MGKKRNLDRSKVLAAAREHVAEQGLDRLTMRALSARVGVEAASLYSHIKDKEDLLDGLAELVFAEVALSPSDDPWPRRFEMYSHMLRKVFLDNARLITVVATRPIVSISTIGLIEQALGELTAYGLDPERAVYALDALVSFVVGHTLAEISADPDIGGHDQEEIATQRAALPAEIFPHVAQTLGSGPIDRDAEFAFGVRLLIAGVAEAIDDRAAFNAWAKV